MVNISVMMLVAGGTWWLSGFDKTVTGESKRTHYFSRVIRCFIILGLTEAFLLFLQKPGSGLFDIGILVFLTLLLALMFRSSVAEVFTHGFLRLIDPTLHDSRPLDPGKSRRYMDTVAHLIKTGQRTEAIKLCEELKLSGEVSRSTLEMTLEFLGVKQAQWPDSGPLAVARRLRAEGKFAETEKRLKSLLIKKPDDLEAAFLLVRLYVEDLRIPAQAREILEKLAKQPYVSPTAIEIMRQSIDEWGKPKLPEPETVALPESIEELLAKGFFGTAIERLEEKIQAQPQDFESRLKLAEVQAVHCQNFPRAEKIIRQIETDAGFSREQAASARSKFREWHEAIRRPKA